ncbi:hypothetical protein GWI33_005829 [Rhynchophorus ferrugineus]|uniref:RanBP2-type domain-containing protein n=1 Tax=Rhynchophorus ferrugineus TaxID=354439 RepID=A0A834IL58_RHYFE|nr:hypothetical protein GWI33_005829 [Rhynchophorus ferrugineus]
MYESGAIRDNWLNEIRKAIRNTEKAGNEVLIVYKELIHCCFDKIDKIHRRPGRLAPKSTFKNSNRYWNELERLFIGEYLEKDSYGNEVSRLARPLPVDYLLLDVPASTPVNPQYTFNPDPSKQPFPVENRFIDGHIQDFNALAAYLQQFAFDEFYEAISDLHFLIYIATMEMLPMREYLEPLLTAIRNKDRVAAKEWSRSEQWATLEQLIAASSPPPSRPGSVTSGNINASGGTSTGPKWTCQHCTYINESDVNSCEICNLPRSQS